jgi:dTDP-4-amino-4,6-dideoxygalactose transaminase
LIGGFGRCEVFSFHATKFLNSFEGGAVTTNDDRLAERLRLMRNFGFVGVDRVDHLGVNGKMTEVCAAMGITSLEAIDEVVATNLKNYEAYRAEISGLRGLAVVRYDEQERSNFQYVVVEVDPATCPQDRDALVARLQRENVLARRYFWPGCHRMEPYRSRPEGIPNLPATERVAARVMVLPTGQAVDVDSIKRIGCILRDVLV